jgi:Ca-activated chloride channel family protein
LNATPLNFLSTTSFWFWSIVPAALLLVVVSLAFSRVQRRRRMNVLLGPVMAERLTPSLNRTARRWRTIFLVVGVFFICLAMARPWWGWRPVPAPTYSRDVLLAVDCSKSMLASDIAPNRLEYAKWFCRRLIASDPADRYGILAFAGDAYLECPLTRDRETLRNIIDDLDTSTIPVGGTNLEAALQTARLAFLGAEGEHRAVVLITDGEELQGTASEELGYYKTNEIPLFIVGLGNPDTSAIVELDGGRFLRDKDGEIVRTRLQEKALQELALEVDGMYIRGGTGGQRAFDAVERAVTELTPATEAQRVVRHPVERYQIPLALGFLCLLLRLCISERRFSGQRATRASVSSVIMLLLFLSSGIYAQSVGPAPHEDAVPAGPISENGLAKEDFEALRARLVDFKKRLDSSDAKEDLAVLHYNSGRIHQRLGENEKAAEAYRHAISASGTADRVRGLALWNLGVMTHGEARLQARNQEFDKSENSMKEAERVYREALTMLGGNSVLGQNLEALYADRELVQTLKKLMEQLNQQQRDAQQKTRDALSKQQKSAATGNPKEQQEAKEATQKASNSVDQYRKSLDNVNAPQKIQKQAESAAEEIEKALEQQRKAEEKARSGESRQDAGEKAEEHLAEALRQLGGNPDEENQMDQQDPSDQQGQQGQQGQQNQQGQQGQQGHPQQNDDTTVKGQAGAILNQLQEEEEDLRKAIKLYEMRGASGYEKDW